MADKIMALTTEMRIMRLANFKEDILTIQDELEVKNDRAQSPVHNKDEVLEGGRWVKR